jgi:DNA (cytosine-5)-methyltransferase 1
MRKKSNLARGTKSSTVRRGGSSSAQNEQLSLAERKVETCPMQPEVVKEQRWTPHQQIQGDFRFIDLFAGIGGIRLAFEGAAGKCVFSSEWDRFSQLTYEANFCERPHGDVTKIAVDDIPPHDVLAAGFPCQPFSQAGLRHGFQDTRGTLFFDVVRIIEKHRPAMILLENVKGFVGHDKGRTMMVVLESLERLGYNVFHKLLNARDFGLPQNRQRIFIVGVNREKLGGSVFEFPKARPVPTSVGQLLERSVDDRYMLSDRLWQGHQRRLAQHREKGNGFGYSLFNSESPYTSTISARYYKDGSEILIEQPGLNPRKLTPREAARLQGFPETFMIPVSDVQAYKQFGNSVAVPVVKAIAEAMSQLLLNSAKRLPNNSGRQLVQFP